MTAPDPHTEAIAEAIVFAHDRDQAGPALLDPEAWELERIAALTTAAIAHRAEVPPHLEARLAAAARQFCAERGAARPAPGRAPRPRTLLAFVVGVAAGLVAWLTIAATTGQPRAATELRAELLAAAPDVQWAWRAGPSPLRGDVGGDVVWSSARQEGYLTFRGLPPLDGAHRFQLWIVDSQRDGAPVDGGVFSIADSARETVLPVRATLPIGRPAAFVVTVEDRAGVVVSEQEHVVAIAGP